MPRCVVVVIMSLLISAGILFLPVNAEDSAGPDTSGSDLDIGAIAVGMLGNDPGVILSPPRWQWDAGRYMEEGKECAVRCESLHKKYINSPENSPDSGSYFNQGIAFCECAQKNYNKAFQLTKDDDYLKQAEIFDAGTSLYDSMGMTREAQQTRRAATAARAQAAAASSLFLPLSPFIGLAGLAGAFLLVHTKRE